MQPWAFRLLLCITLLALVASAEPMPTMPMVLSGNVYINGAPAPIDTVIKAMIGEEVKGSTVLSQTGIYGLKVQYGQGLVEFYVNDVKAPQSVEWSTTPGTLNLTVMIAQTGQIAPTSTQLESGQLQASRTTATATSTASPKVGTPAIPEATNTISQEKNESQPVDLQRREAVKVPGIEAGIVVLMVLLASKVIIGGKK
jgi:hypothetical protein